MTLKTRNAIVTGSTSGIGLAIARGLAAEGANVVINGFGDAGAIEKERGSIEKDFGVKFLGSKANEGTSARRGNNGSAVVDGDAVIVPVGSTNGATLVCFDKGGGKVLWKAGDDEAAYSSPVVATLAGVRTN